VAEKIRLGIIGCGGIARGRHLTGLTALKRAGLDQCDVTALCDTVEENLDAAAAYLEREHGRRPERFTSWEECITRGPVDAVDICLPHGLHHVVGIAALGAGLHVVMEKPYTVTVKTGRALAEAADRAGRVLATAVPHRRMPGQRAVWWAINEARLLGQPRLFFADYTQFRAQPRAAAGRGLSPAASWRRDRLMGGGAGVIDSGFHFLDSIQYFFGPVERVHAELRALSQETRNIVFYGSEGSIEDTGYSDRFVIYHLFMNGGELRSRDGGYLSMGELQGRMRRELGPERTQRLFPNGVTDHFAVELWDFLDAVQAGRPPEVDGWGGLATTALVEAIYESGFAGTSVRVADVLEGKIDGGWQQDLDAYWDAHPAPALSRA
jgi:predicted dehydrogenase